MKIENIFSLGKTLSTKNSAETGEALEVGSTWTIIAHEISCT